MSDGLDIDDIRTNGIKYIGDLQRLTIKPGDIFVVQFEQTLNQEQRKRGREILEEELQGHKVIVLDGNAKISILDPLPDLGVG